MCVCMYVCINIRIMSLINLYFAYKFCSNAKIFLKFFVVNDFFVKKIDIVCYSLLGKLDVNLYATL